MRERRSFGGRLEAGGGVLSPAEDGQPQCYHETVSQSIGESPSEARMAAGRGSYTECAESYRCEWMGPQRKGKLEG